MGRPIMVPVSMAAGRPPGYRRLTLLLTAAVAAILDHAVEQVVLEIRPDVVGVPGVLSVAAGAVAWLRG